MAKTETPSTELVLPGNKQLPQYLLNPAALPPSLDGLIDLRGWLNSLGRREEYKQPDPTYLESRMLLIGLMAETPEEVMNGTSNEGLQSILPNHEGATTGNIMIDELYVAPSQMTEGNKTFVIISFTYERSGTSVTTTTGATNLQRQFLQLLCMGVWPLEGQIMRMKNRDRGGRHLLTFAPLDVA